MDDHELLREFTAHRSERAFAALVEKHLPLVYGTALRLVRDSTAAQDVAQSVFIDLARKAWSVRPGTLPGWLYRATQHAAYMAIRTETRRLQRETHAMNLAEQNRENPATIASLAPLLDDALRQLNQVEQDALLLRYFDGQSISETGRQLSLSEPAAQKRITRALEKMRAYFARQGVTASAALLAATLGTHAATLPPAGLAGKITGPSLAGVVTPVGGVGTAILFLRILFMSTKTKIAAVILIMALIGSGTWWFWQHTPSSPKIATAPNVPASSKPAPESKPSTLASPSLPPPASPVAVQLTASTTAIKTVADPRVELAKTDLRLIIADMIRLLESGDAAGAMLSHLPPELNAGVPPIRSKPIDINSLNLPADMPPEEVAKDKQMIMDMNIKLADANSKLANSPEMKSELIEYQSILDAAPKLNEAGDEATYTLDAATLAKISAITGDPKPYNKVIFYKIHGQWYTDKPDQ